MKRLLVGRRQTKDATLQKGIFVITWFGLDQK